MERDTEAGKDSQSPVRKESARYSPIGHEKIPLMDRGSASGKSASDDDDGHYDYPPTGLEDPKIPFNYSDTGQADSGGSSDYPLSSSSSGHHQIADRKDKNKEDWRKFKSTHPPAIYTTNNSKDKKPDFIFGLAGKENNNKSAVTTQKQKCLVEAAPRSDANETQFGFTNSKMIDKISDALNLIDENKYLPEDCSTFGSHSSADEDRYVAGLEPKGDNTTETAQNDKNFKTTQSSGGDCHGEEDDDMEWDSSDDEIKYTKQKQPTVQKDLTKFVGEDFPEAKDDETDLAVTLRQEGLAADAPKSDTTETLLGNQISDALSLSNGDKYPPEDLNTSGITYSSSEEDRYVPGRVADEGPTSESQQNVANRKTADLASEVPKVATNSSSYLREDSNTSDQSQLSTSASSNGYGYAPVHMHMVPMACNGEEEDGMEWDSSDDEIKYTKQKQSEVQKDPTEFDGEDFPEAKDDDGSEDE